MAQFPSDTRYAEIGWAVKRIPLGEEVQKLSYHPPMECYLLGTSKLVDFELPKDDELHREWARESMFSLCPCTPVKPDNCRHII